jgi:hypothetical protein
MKIGQYTILLFFIFVTFSCRKDFTAELSSGNLQFSKDTVFLDTVFSQISSSTYNLKVYNNSSNAISIPSIQLGKGENSFYRLNVNGKFGKNFQNVEILGKDSIFIFIEATIDYSQIESPIYKDSIVFDASDKLQDVKLITLVQDAHFLFPSKNASGFIETINIGTNANNEPITVNGFYLDDNTTFSNEKPYVIYGYCAVANNNMLTIEAGAKIYFHANSGLIVNKNATLKINGTLSEPVLIQGDRLEPAFKEIPGQWGTIWLRAGSKDNLINNTIIKNASVGIISDSIGSSLNPTLTIKNSQIYNSSGFGILGRETAIEGLNLVINNSGQSSLACTIGGSYTFTHATFANFWNGSLRQYPSVLINNYYTYFENNAQITIAKDLLKANFVNCIIDGNNPIEIALDKNNNAQFNYLFENNLIRFNDIANAYANIPEYNFNDTAHYSQIILNGDSYFKSPLSNNLIIGELSDAIGKANSSGTLAVPFDILGVLRTQPADLGAYEHITFN